MKNYLIFQLHHNWERKSSFEMYIAAWIRERNFRVKAIPLVCIMEKNEFCEMKNSPHVLTFENWAFLFVKWKNFFPDRIIEFDSSRRF